MRSNLTVTAEACAVVCAIGLLAFGGPALGQARQAPTAGRTTVAPPELVHVTTADGLRLAATFYPAFSPARGAMVLLLHAAFEDRSSWHEFAVHAQRADVSALALDLRGHGESGGGRAFTPAMDADVDAALEWISASPRTRSLRLGIAGASLGANLALRAGVRHRAVRSVALLSPGTQLWEIGIGDSVGPYRGRPLLLMAAEEDGYAASTVRTLAQSARGACRLELLPGNKHGVRMLEDTPALRDTLIDWFRETAH